MTGSVPAPAGVDVPESLVDTMRSWRRDFHRHPELGFAVDATAAKVAGLLQDFGVDDVHTGIGGTGVVGVIRRGDAGSTPSIGLRADMDALPISEANTFDHRSQVDGRFHGCGHDGHTAMLLGAAQLLASDHHFAGTVVLIFQPNEENGRGAQAMIADGLFKRFPVDAVFGLHNMPGLAVGHFETRVGSMMSSEDLFEIVIRGRGGHASMPEHHIDPVIVAAQIINGLQTIVSRSVPSSEIAVVSVTEVLTDGARNIVPSTVTIRGDCRSFTEATRATIERRMGEIAAGVAAAHGAQAEVSYTSEFVPLVNTEAESAAAVAAARAVVGADRVNPACALWAASEDFARMLAEVPGCYINLGNGVDGPCGKSLHNPNYDFNDDAAALGVAYWVQLVHDLLPIAS